MRKSLLFCLTAALSLLSMPQSGIAQTKPEEKPLLVIGGLSDFHTEYGMISCSSVDNVRLRGSIPITLQSIGANEDVDMFVFGGDYTSQNNATSAAHWERSRDLLIEAARNAFAPGKPTPVLYAGGNHEFDAAGYGTKVFKKFDCWDYYTTPMRTDIGLLDSENSFYESVPNFNATTGSSRESLNILAAYYYQINGFDFIVLNTGKYLAESNANYFYSEESVEWVGKKLEQLYTENPDRTVFFLCHIPFRDSNSLSSDGTDGDKSKGQWEPEDPGTGKDFDSRSAVRQLKEYLAKYPNTIMLYGHDHGTNKAFIREKTSQRVTRYDVKGKKISSFDDTHVDAKSGDEPVEEGVTDGMFFLMNKGNGKYLGLTEDGAVGFNEEDSRHLLRVFEHDPATHSFKVSYDDSGTAKYLDCGGNGYYNLKASTYNNEQNCGFWFEIEDLNATPIKGKLVSGIVSGRNYFLVHSFSGVKYALGNSAQLSSKNEPRIGSKSVTVTDNTVIMADIDAARDYIFTAMAQPAAKKFTSGKFYVQNYETGKYLGVDDKNNICLTDEEKQLMSFSMSATNQMSRFNVLAENKLDKNKPLKLTLNNTDKMFNFKNSTMTSLNNSAYWYCVIDTAATPVQAVRVDSLEVGQYYIIVNYPVSTTSIGKKAPYAVPYALGNTPVDLTKSSVVYKYLSSTVVEVADESVVNDTISFASLDVAKPMMYCLEEEEVEPDGDPSFVSVFLGSMRYYDNDAEGSWGSQSDSQRERTGKIIQALMIYVYEDRVEFQMKNYGETGTIHNQDGAETSLRIKDELTPYIIYRKMIPQSDHPTPTAMQLVSEDQVRSTNMYSIYGTVVDENYHGIVIIDGKKYYKD